MSTRGTFIVIEGGEGSGKSTLAKALQKHYGDRILSTREPGGSPLGELIRNFTLSDAGRDSSSATRFYLMCAARLVHLEQVVIPALTRGMTVVCDRFDASTFAYQIFGEQAYELKQAFWTCRQQLPVLPDAYLYLSGSPKELLPRALRRQEKPNRYDKQTMDFHERVTEGYRRLFRCSHLRQRVVEVDATQSEQAVFEKASEELFSHLSTSTSI